MRKEAQRGHRQTLANKRQRVPPSAFHIQSGSQFTKRLPNLFYERDSFAVIAQIEEVRAKLRAKSQESV